MSVEYLDISDCPKCSTRHRYRLNVERSIVIKKMIVADVNESERKVRVTRIFTCPEKDEEFQATFVLTDTPSDQILDVTVIGVDDDG